MVIISVSWGEIVKKHNLSVSYISELCLSHSVLYNRWFALANVLYTRWLLPYNMMCLWTTVILQRHVGVNSLLQTVLCYLLFDVPLCIVFLCIVSLNTVVLQCVMSPNCHSPTRCCVSEHVLSIEYCIGVRLLSFIFFSGSINDNCSRVLPVNDELFPKSSVTIQSV